MKKDILTLNDLTKDDFDLLLNRAAELKARHRKGIIENSLTGKILGLVFEKVSTRTRISFQAAMAQMGGTSIFISTQDTQMTRSESIEDTARVLSGYLDALVVRTYSQDVVTAFGQFADIPIINGLTDLCHPCQVLSDLMTIIERKPDYQNLKISWFGDGNNVANSWINAATKLGLNLTLACPIDFTPQIPAGVNVTISSDPHKAADKADVIYTDVWTSMGQNRKKMDRKETFAPFQINAELVSRAAPDAIVMHCLPAHRGEEISAEILDGSHSVVWQQAENKLHMGKAILEILINT